MALVADEGLALFAGLNAIPKKSSLAEYSPRIDHAMTSTLLAAWQEPVTGAHLLPRQRGPDARRRARDEGDLP